MIWQGPDRILRSDRELKYTVSPILNLWSPIEAAHIVANETPSEESWGFELFLNLDFSDRSDVGGAPPGRARLSMLADIARPRSNDQVTS